MPNCTKSMILSISMIEIPSPDSATWWGPGHATCLPLPLQCGGHSARGSNIMGVREYVVWFQYGFWICSIVMFIYTRHDDFEVYDLYIQIRHTLKCENKHSYPTNHVFFRMIYWSLGPQRLASSWAMVASRCFVPALVFPIWGMEIVGWERYRNWKFYEFCIYYIYTHVLHISIYFKMNHIVFVMPWMSIAMVGNMDLCESLNGFACVQNVGPLSKVQSCWTSSTLTWPSWLFLWSSWLQRCRFKKQRWFQPMGFEVGILTEDSYYLQDS